ncbi:MAG: DUF488 family protein [Ktedonobacterales bacterium]
MEIYTCGFTQKSARQFFELLRRTGIRRLIDVRLKNVSQLAGFAKKDDLAYFLAEICQAEYLHEPLLAPTEEMFDAYKRHTGSWPEYEQRFLNLMAERRIEQCIDRRLFEVPTVLMCSEATPERCHRRLVVDYLGEKWGNITPVHL